MKIYTSYWAQVKNFPPHLVGLNTTMWPPRWRELGKDKRGVWVLDCPPVKPGKQCEGLCNGKCEPRHPNTCTFLEVYYLQLNRINFTDFMKHLQDLHDKICAGEGLNDIDFAFIFFEAPANKCSERGPFQAWFAHNDMPISEWKPNI